MLLDNVLEHIEQRVSNIMWTFEELDGLNIHQLAAIRELVSSAVTDTRRAFKNATLEISNV